MRILLVSSAFSGLTQRFYCELDDAGYTVSVELHLGDDEKLVEGIELFKPDLIVCPYLTKKIPKKIYQIYKCLIVHPGIKGDRGPSSLDWAIQQGLDEWGVTLLEADEEMDAGPIWASKHFALRETTKSSIFNREVSQAAIDCLWESLAYFDARDFNPEPLDYSKPDIKGQLMPAMKQADRAIDWKKSKTDDILKRIRAADGSPGLLDEIYSKPFYLYNAQRENYLTGKPGEIIAIANQAICRATVDGAIWIGHLKPSLPDKSGIKLPAAQALKDLLPNPQSGLQGLLTKPIRNIEINYTFPGRQLPCQEVWYELDKEAAYIHFQFHNGAMNTNQCKLLLSVYQFVATLNIKVIVLLGGEDFWSNGIHLNQIEAAESPAAESWKNINAMNELVYQIINTLDKLTIAAVVGNAGAGGAVLALAADRVFVRNGVIFNPHYKNMGGLYGSEFWTYLLPKRVGHDNALRMMEDRLPISAKKAWRIGLADKVLDNQNSIFIAQIKHLVNTFLTDNNILKSLLRDKANVRCLDESKKPLAAYQKFELTQMYANFYGDHAYHKARHNFVFKKPACKTPQNLAKHRQTSAPNNALPNSSTHFVSENLLGSIHRKTDNEQGRFYLLVENLLSATSKETMLDNMFEIYQYVKEKFREEEQLMKQAEFHDYKNHAKEHHIILEKLMAIDVKIQHDNCKAEDIQKLIDKWTSHTSNMDALFDRYFKIDPISKRMLSHL